MKKTIIIGVIIFIFGIITIPGFEQSEMVKSDKEAELEKTNKKNLSVLDICYSIQNLDILQYCKNESIPEIINNCKYKENLELSVCSDPRLKTFYGDMDERIKSLE